MFITRKCCLSKRMHGQRMPVPLMPSNRFRASTIKLEVPLPCKLCHSVQQSNFKTEINIHFPGPKNLNKSSVWAFPTLLVCLNCGFTEFVLDRRELARLRDDSFD